MSRLLHKVRI